ncbi:ribose-5-phosphate isomerase RpiA [Cohnella sp. GCM10027633]|uniref:ribose-5-phosphate isomerase RpiA n=1 Tax=unclassified Cohnella TaxID=2636738 RepID=UPI0036294FE9
MNAKKAAAEQAAERIREGMIVGLGTGSTAYWAIRRIAERVGEGLAIRAVSSSARTEQLAGELGIPLLSLAEVDVIDIYIDGADEVDGEFNLIKGGGGALLREKILAYNSQAFVVIVDESKLVATLGKFPVPVEVVPFAVELTLKNLAKLQCEPSLRLENGEPYITDNGNYIIDCSFHAIPDPARLNERIRSIPGVVESGLFPGMTKSVIVGREDGTTYTP